MAPQYARYMPNNAGYHDREYHIDLEGFLQDTAVASRRNDYSHDKIQTNVTASEQLSEESKATNSQFFSHKPSNGNSILNLDGNNSPQDDDFPAPIGFQRATTGFNLPTAGTRASQGPAFNPVGPQKWTGGPKPYHLLTPRELKALGRLKGPPPGMPEHMIPPEDRKYCIFKGSKGPKASISRPRTPQQQLTGGPSTPAAPKRKTKDRTHQLARPSGISKPRFDLSGVRAATTRPVRNTRHVDVSHQASPGTNNGFLANGVPRLPPLSLSRKAYRDLGTYALRHNGRIPFKKGFGLPSHGRLVYFGPGRLGVKLDRHFSAPEGSLHGPRDTDGTQARRSNGTSTFYQQYGAAATTKASSQTYAPVVTAPMLDDYHSMQMQAEVDTATQDLGHFAPLNQGEPMAFAPQGSRGQMALQQPILEGTSYGPSMGIPQDLLLQQPVQWQSPHGTPQQYSRQPELSFPGFGNTPSTLQQMARYDQQPGSHSLDDAVRLPGFDTITGTAFAPEFPRTDLMQRATSDSPGMNMQYPLPTTQDNDFRGGLSMHMYEPTPPPSQHTTPQLVEENSLSFSQPSTLASENDFTFEGEPVYEYPNGPMAGWLVEGHYYPFEAVPATTQAILPTPPPEHRQEQHHQQDQQEDLDLADKNDNIVLPMPATTGEDSSSSSIDAPNNTADTATSTANHAVIPATDDAALDFEALTAQFLRDYQGDSGEGEDEDEDELF